MNVDPKALESKLREMHPDINRHEMELSLDYNETKKAWVVKLNKGAHSLTTHVDDKSAEECLNGIECVYLGVQISEFIKNFETPTSLPGSPR